LGSDSLLSTFVKLSEALLFFNTLVRVLVAFEVTSTRSQIIVVSEQFLVAETGKRWTVTRPGNMADVPKLSHCSWQGIFLTADQRAGALSGRRDQLFHAHFSGHFRLTASPKQWMISTHISLFTVHSFPAFSNTMNQKFIKTNS
jgi:hypothetical protein